VLLRDAFHRPRRTGQGNDAGVESLHIDRQRPRCVPLRVDRNEYREDARRIGPELIESLMNSHEGERAHVRAGGEAECDEAIARGESVLVEGRAARSEEHTSELQSLAYLVCRLLLEKKKTNMVVCISNVHHT